MANPPRESGGVLRRAAIKAARNAELEELLRRTAAFPVLGGLLEEENPNVLDAIRELALPAIEQRKLEEQAKRSGARTNLPPVIVPGFRGLTGVPSLINPQVGHAPKQRVKPNKTLPLRSKYRSEIKRAIFLQLWQEPEASDLAICRAFDATGNVELPGAWQPSSGEREFERAYKNDGIRPKIEKTISKVRVDMRKSGLLPDR